MNTSSRFAVATHLLIMLALYKRVGGSPLKSDRMAQSADTNAVVIRRLLGALQTAGLVESRSGPNGGFVLAKPADKISLRAVYDAVERGPLFHMHYGSPQEDCPVGSNVVDLMDEVVEETRQAVRDTLHAHRLDELALRIAERSGLIEYMDQGLSADQIHALYLAGKEGLTNLHPTR